MCQYEASVSELCQIREGTQNPDSVPIREGTRKNELYEPFDGLATESGEYEWSCPHDPHGDSEYCIFHMFEHDPDCNESLEKNEEKIKEKFLDCVKHDNSNLNEFIGATFGNLNLNKQIISDGPPVNLRFAQFRGPVSIRRSIIEPFWLMDGAIFHKSANFYGSEFQRRLTFGHCIFHEDINFSHGTVQKWFNLRRASIKKSIDLSWLSAEWLSCHGLSFNKRFDCYGAKLDYAGFVGVSFTGERGNRDGEIDMSQSEISEGLITYVKNQASIPEYNFTQARVGDLDIRNKTDRIDYYPRKVRAEDVEKILRGEDTDCSRELIWCYQSVNFYLADSGSMSDAADQRVYVDREYESSNENCVFSHICFDRTTFNGFDFTKYKEDLSPEWVIDQSQELEPKHREVTYLKAKIGAKNVGYKKAEAEFFLNEMHYARKRHRKNVRNKSISYKSRMYSFVKWSSSSLYNITCGYGERPLRPFVASVVIIALSTIIYVFFGTEVSVLEALEVSLQSFVGFMIGPPPSNLAFNLALLSGFEALIGAFLIALFVFTLTRSLDR
jgi:hypothetical protein